jgi:hypothetical protein
MQISVAGCAVCETSLEAVSASTDTLTISNIELEPRPYTQHTDTA